MDDRSAGVVLAQERQDLIVGQRVAPASDDREHVLVGVVPSLDFAVLGRDQRNGVRCMRDALISLRFDVTGIPKRWLPSGLGKLVTPGNLPNISMQEHTRKLVTCGC